MGTFTGCLVVGVSACLVVFSLSPRPLTRAPEASAEAVRLALDCNVRISFPKWTAGVSQLTAAVAILTCESQQPTPPSWVLGLQSCGALGGLPLWFPGKELCLCCTATASGAQLRTLIFMESCRGVRQDRPSTSGRVSETPQPFCAQQGASVSPLQKCLPNGWNPGPGHVEKETRGLCPQRRREAPVF